MQVKQKFLEQMDDLQRYSQLFPCGHLAIMDTPIIRTAAKSPAKINYRCWTEINSRYYGLSLLWTLTHGPEGIHNKGVDYTPIFLFQLVEMEITVPCTHNFHLYFVVFLCHHISFFYHISPSVRMVWLVNFVGCISLYGLLNFN